MSVMLLLVLALVSMQKSWPRPPNWLENSLGSTGPLTATLACIMLVWTIGSLYAWFCSRAIRRDPSQARRRLKRFHARQKIYFAMLTAAFLGCLYFLGWGQFSQSRWIWPGQQIVLLTPFLLGLVGSWARFYDPEKALHQVEAQSIDALRAFETGDSTPSHVPFLSRKTYLGLQIRFNLLLIAPPLFLMLLRETFLWSLPGMAHSRMFEPAFFTVFLLMALVGMPWMLRIFLGLRPLPAGPLRERLEDTVRRLKFRFSAILLWNTRNSSANAMVTGILPWPRYIVLTDQLLRDLSPDEVEAVIGHEIGHVKHHHMFFYMMFLFASLVSLGMIWQFCEIFLRSKYALDLAQDWIPTLAPWLEKNNLDLITAFPPLLAVALYLFLVFGYLSRCCETQADIFGSRTVSNEVFISALEKVAILNSIPREKPGWLSSWRHPTIANRVDFLRRMAEDPGMERRFQRRVGALKWSLVFVLTLVLVTLSRWVPDQTKQDHDALQGTWLVEEFDYNGAEFSSQFKFFLRVKGDLITVEKAGEIKAEIGKATFKLDAVPSPKCVDLQATFLQFEMKMEGIYTLNDDVLLLCLGGNGQVRPDEFKSTAGVSLLRLRRQRN
jgi:uncharacterized protein (TIGR03067 family)